MMFKPYQRYAEFSGRSTRTEYWLFTLFYTLAYLFLLMVSVVTAGIGMMLLVILILGSFIPALSVAVRRLHDTDRSGWNLLWLLLPFVGSIVLLVFLCLPSSPGENSYGSPDGDYDTPPVPQGDQLDRLEKLARLRDDNVLTEEEFAERKARIMGQI